MNLKIRSPEAKCQLGYKHVDSGHYPTKLGTTQEDK